MKQLYLKGIFTQTSFINFDVFKSFDFILHDIILLNLLIVGHDMLPKYQAKTSTIKCHSMNIACTFQVHIHACVWLFF